MNPTRNITDPKSISAIEIPMNSEANAAGDTSDFRLHVEFGIGKGTGSGGYRRVLMIIDESS